MNESTVSSKPKHIVEYIFFRASAFIVQRLPLRHVHTIGFALARLAYPLLKSRRNIALENLRYAFPEMDESQRRQIALQSFQSIGAAFLELLWYPNFTKAGIKQRVRIENLELLQQLQEKKKGIIFLTAHYGSWELASQAITVYSDTPVCTIAKPQSNLLVDRIITRWRELFGLKIVAMGISVREILRTLQEGGIIALAADQSAPKESVAVNFFGRSVPTFQGPALFSLKTGAPIILGCTVRQENGNYTMRFVHVPGDDLDGASDENILELTRRHVHMTELLIRQNPEQWMWMHKRWKHVRVPAEAA
jgi:Kdo2-lipid IVA lauroyltransferase/acyltransferase